MNFGKAFWRRNWSAIVSSPKLLGPRIAEEITNGLRFYAVDEKNNETQLPIDSTLVSDFRNDQPLQVSLRLNANLPTLRRDRIKFIRIGTTVDTNAGPRNIDTILPLGSKIIVHSGQMGYRTAHLAQDLFNQSRIINDLSGTDGVLIFTPLSRQELRRPREEDKEYANGLLKYLNDHLEQAHRIIWVEGIRNGVTCCSTVSSLRTAAAAVSLPLSRIGWSESSAIVWSCP